MYMNEDKIGRVDFEGLNFKAESGHWFEKLSILVI